MYLGYQNGKIKFYTANKLPQEFYNLDKVEETELVYILDGDCYVLKDEAWEEKQAQKERERRNQEINQKISELEQMAISDVLQGNKENINTYNQVIASLRENLETP